MRSTCTQSRTPIEIASGTVVAASNGNPSNACEGKTLIAVNNQFGGNFTPDDITNEFQYSTGAPPGQQ